LAGGGATAWLNAATVAGERALTCGASAEDAMAWTGGPALSFGGPVTLEPNGAAHRLFASVIPAGGTSGGGFLPAAGGG